jgi:hypothetical protein
MKISYVAKLSDCSFVYLVEVPAQKRVLFSIKGNHYISLPRLVFMVEIKDNCLDYLHVFTFEGDFNLESRLLRIKFPNSERGFDVCLGGDPEPYIYMPDHNQIVKLALDYFYKSKFERSTILESWAKLTKANSDYVVPGSIEDSYVLQEWFPGSQWKEYKDEI